MHTRHQVVKTYNNEGTGVDSDVTDRIEGITPISTYDLSIMRLPELKKKRSEMQEKLKKAQDEYQGLQTLYDHNSAKNKVMKDALVQMNKDNKPGHEISRHREVIQAEQVSAIGLFQEKLRVGAIISDLNFEIAAYDKQIKAIRRES